MRNGNMTKIFPMGDIYTKNFSTVVKKLWFGQSQRKCNQEREWVQLSITASEFLVKYQT